MNPFYLANDEKNVFSKPTEIEIHKISNKKIDFKFTIDNKNFDYKDSKYFSGLLSNPPKRGARVDILSVKYSANIGEVFCKSTDEAVDVWLPKFPYLSYWYVSPEQRVRYTYRTGKTDIVNPCATNELADFNKPYFYCYFWNLFREESDELCEKTYQNKKNNIKLKIVKTSTLRKYKRPTFTEVKNINIVYGNLKQDLSLKDIKDIDMAWKTKKLFTYDLPINQKNFFKMLLKLKSEYGFSVSDWDFKSNHILVSLKNKTKNINLFVGSTDLFSTMGANHQKFMQDSLYSADMLIYWGHAGLGLNFDFGDKIDREKIRAKKLALLSCYSYRYFKENALYKTKKLDGVFYTGNDLLTGYKEILKVLALTMDGEKRKEYGNDGYTFYKSL